MNIISLINKDLSKYVSSGGLKIKLKTVIASHAFHLVLCIRIGQLLRTIPFIGSLLGVVVEYFIRVVFASDISLKSRIGPGLMIVHGHDIVIGGDVLIGENCKILNGVTLGNKDTESAINQQPEIGSNVVIGAGAKILGNIKIGDNVKVGANSVVLSEVPDNHVAVGVPARNMLKP
ncbi:MULTISPECIES: serine O-acetyltransferase [Aeromonas]|uniref:serine O-acetyltransferase n=1 Tax=Aeromonas TaxID=642 RepID=UPI0009C19FD7|nr:serine O-acetyltransferase [Aeromonas veronii]MBL0623815.1 serine acetyltransferase [Aeromonas veronii]MCF5884416.1 serine O-acetyltransferase [Aeromonas veronii]